MDSTFTTIKIINANTLATTIHDCLEVEEKPNMTVVRVVDANPFLRSFVRSPTRTCQGDVYLLKYNGMGIFSQLVTATMVGNDVMLRFEHISVVVAA
jgi:hypothetical protein